MLTAAPSFARRIRRARSQDVARILELERACGLSAWRSEDYQAMMETSNIDLLVACTQGRAVGFGAARRLPPEVELLQLAVDPQWRRQGFGCALLGRLLDLGASFGCEECFLEVRCGNLSAIDFYQTLGFRNCGLRKNYYREPVEDARVMRKDLRTAPR